MESQNKMIKKFLEDGNSITGLDALNRFQCNRLASRICDLKDSGMSIDSQFIKLKNGKRVKEYWMANDSDPKNEKNSG